MITLEDAYIFAGLVFAAFAGLGLSDRSNPRRLGNSLFWALVAVSFLFGSRLGNLENGTIALALAILGASRLLGPAPGDGGDRGERARSAARFGNWLFVPALLVPFTALVGSIGLKNLVVAGQPLIEPRQATVISLALGVLVAGIAAMAWLRPRPVVPFEEGRRLMDAIGWAAVLPQMLASLGALFALAGVGREVGRLVADYVPLTHPLTVIAAYCFGMAVFTAIMGNAFAAFPVMTAAIGLPLIVHKFGGSPAIMSALGMLSGFCGTLTTPMAANFNIVPAALLELPDRNAVIKAQWPTAVLLLACNVFLMYVLVFRFAAHRP
ncbi:MAG TPA: DUF979 domain-containing protein [Rhizomicrobium sp.]